MGIDFSPSSRGLSIKGDYYKINTSPSRGVDKVSRPAQLTSSDIKFLVSLGFKVISKNVKEEYRQKGYNE